MSLITLVFLIIAIFILIAKSADIVLKNLIKIARKLSISEFTVGFFILGFATSLPEIFIAVNSIIDNNMELSVGNLVGASLVLLTLAMSLPSLLTGRVRVRNVIDTKDIVVAAFTISLPVFLLFDGKLSRSDGFVLAASYFLFIYFLNEEQTIVERVREAIERRDDDLHKDVLRLLLGMAGLFVFSKLLVDLSLMLSAELSVPTLVVGLLLLSIGTNLPELSLGIKSATSHHRNIGVGDFFGSAAANTFVLSVLVMFEPVVMEDMQNIRVTGLFLLLGVVLFSVFIRSKRELSRREGLVLLSTYLIFLIFEALFR